ncbi:MAG: hypothetical protein ACHQYP_02630 [Nitrospiria bacterium]
MKFVFSVTLIVILTMTGPAFAQSAESRPSEDSLFGEPNSNQNVLPVPKPAPKTKEREEGRELGSSNPERDAFATGEVKDNPLQIGGTYYQRLIVSAQQNVSASDTPISAPLQFDAFLDSRPSDRIRGFVDERLLYDPTRDQYGNTTNGTNGGNLQFSSGSTAPAGLFALPTTPVPVNPQMVLDQAWLKFDIEHKVFVTAGKQHVRWGSARFWNPTDFLNTQKMDPLLPYDLRLGNTMLKLEWPIESRKTNLYAITTFDNPQPSSTLGQMGEAFRFEKVIGNSELGIDAVYRGNVAPAYGLDFSAPLGPFDVYTDLAYLTEPQNLMYQIHDGLVSGIDLSSQYTATGLAGPEVQISGGLNYDFAWKENRQATVGFEYFYNQNGYTNPSIYPVLMFLGQFEPFYTGRQYAAIYLTAEGPDNEKHTSYTFSTLGNFSDNSFISRIDFSWRFLTYLTFEAYIDGHYGTQGGEFNFALMTPALTYQGTAIPAQNIPATITDIGMSLRLGF